jgi:hypothetical protein
MITYDPQTIVDCVRVLIQDMMLNVLHQHALYDDKNFYPLMPKKCSIRDCPNTRDEGQFVGALCAPCSEEPYRVTKKNYEHLLAHMSEAPSRLVLYCPAGHQHVDEGEWATRPHRTHQCQWTDGLISCKLEWRPSPLPTFGVASL